MYRVLNEAVGEEKQLGKIGMDEQLNMEVPLNNTKKDLKKQIARKKRRKE